MTEGWAWVVAVDGKDGKSDKLIVMDEGAEEAGSVAFEGGGAKDDTADGGDSIGGKAASL